MFTMERFYLAVVTGIFSERREAARREERGAAMVEYGLLIAFIAVVALVGVKLLGGKINTLFGGISFT